MEQWQALIEGYPKSPDLRYFGKVLQTAGVVLKDDLAPFEIEWIIETLLFKPVDLLSIISLKRNEDAWFKSIGDSFKLLSDIISSHAESIEQHYEEIVTLCLRSYDAQTRKQALLCLTGVAERSPAGARDAARHVAALEEVPTGKAPLALLVGTICENHPEVVADDITKIWRIYLVLLESNKNTDTITSAVLRGLLGLMKHFGNDLPTAELGMFYDKMTNDLMHMSKCEDVCLTILAEHCHLFCERVARDARARGALWRALHDARAPAARALRAAYAETCAVVDSQMLQQIINAELLPQSQSIRTQVKYTALRILTHIKIKHGISSGDTGHTDIQTLEFELRNDNVTYDTAEAVAWCIEADLPNSDKLLQTAMLFYSNLPATKKKDIVVHGMLNASSELRTASVNFLISESCQDPSLEKYQPLWADLFDTNKGKDTVVVDKCRLVFEDYVGYVVSVLENFLENERVEKLPDRLTTLLQLTSSVVTLQTAEEFTGDLCAVLLCLLVEVMRVYGCSAALVAAVRAVAGHVREVDGEIWQTIRIDRCRDEALLCESCLALMEAPGRVRAGDVLMALQIIFSRNDVEPKTLSKALQKLENIMLQAKDDLDQNCLGDIIHLVEKLQHRKDLSGKDARVLHRDVLMFLGKYGNNSNSHSNLSVTENTLIVKLNDLLILNLPNPTEGTTYKINLQRILQLALIHEEPNTLQILLVIICANLSTRKEATLQHALTLAARSLARAHAHARGAPVDARALQAALGMCDTAACVQGILTYISEEKSPGVRKMLSDALEALVAREPGSGLTDSLVSAVAEHAAVMMSASHSTTKRAGLDITETLVTALKENNTLTKKLLPNILVLISKTNETDSEITFEVASTLFLEKIELFESETLENIIEELLQTIIQNGGGVKDKMADESELKAYKNTVKMCVSFVKKVYDYKQEETSKILEVFFDVFEKQNGYFGKVLYVLAEIRYVFDLKADSCRNVLSYKDCFVLNKLLSTEIEENHFCMETVLKFLEEYCEIVLELQCQNSLAFLSKIIKNLTPNSVKCLHRNIKSCLSVYRTNLINIPQILIISFEQWCMKLPIKEITRSIDKELFTYEHALIVNALKMMLNIFDLSDLSILTEIASHIQNWPRILLKLYSTEYITNYLKAKTAYLSDLLTVSVRFLKVTDLKRLILEGHNLHGVSNEKIGFKFCRYFMSVFYDVLVKKPFILLDADMGTSCILLNDIIKCALKRKCTETQNENVLELVDQLWPTYETHATFNQKHSLLLDLASLPTKLGPDSNPLQWATGVVCSEASREDKARLIGVLPGGDAYSVAYRKFASTLPIRLSEMRGGAAASLRALLDALAANSDPHLLDIVFTLASGDETRGWWDEAIDSCMASVALGADGRACAAAYARCWDPHAHSAGACDRALLPLLRYSTPQFCERFFSTTIKDLLAVLRKVQAAPALGSAAHRRAYRKSLVDYIQATSLLRVAFEKIPPASIESPSSVLYSETPTQQSWYLVRETCKWCTTLRDKVKLPADADDEIKTYYRKFQCANYACLCAAICRLRPAARIYEHIFNAHAWASIVDCDVTYSLNLKSQWTQRTRRHPTSVEVPGGAGGGGGGVTSLTLMTSPRTRLFLRTLSENPLLYDLIADERAEDTMSQQPTNQELQLSDNELNGHECAATLTAVLCHATTLPHAQWRNALAAALSGDLHRNAKWLVAQAICNCKEELKPHASALRPALLALISITVCVENERRLLNGLHVDVLETVIHWREESPAPSPHLDSAVQALITTCLENRQRVPIYRSLVDTLGNVLDIYGAVVNVSFSVFEPYLQDNSSEANKTIQILQRLTKSNVYMPELLPTLTAKLETKQWYQLSKLSELFGLALAACRGSTSGFVARYRRVLESVRSDGAEYVKVLYYAQAGHAACCDDNHFRIITDLVRKVPGAVKSKCLSIISAYITHHPEDETIPDMYETIDICELIAASPAEGLGVAAVGLGCMREGVRRRVVMQAAGCCGDSVGKVRGAACRVMLKAFDDLFTSTDSSRASKRVKSSTTPILSTLDSNDIYIKTVMACLGGGVTDRDEEVAKLARAGVAKRLCAADITVRFAECFLMAVYLPMTSSNKSLELSVCLSALLAMLFSDLRAQERFQKVRLRDEPMAMRESTSAPSKLLTMSRTYQGTLRRQTLTGRRTNVQIKESSTPDIDIQISIDSILETLLQFSKDTPDAAQTLCVQFAKCLLSSEGRGFDFRSCMASQLATLVSRDPNELTPIVLELCGVFADDVCKVSGFQEAVEKLKAATVGTEGELHTRLLYEDTRLRCMDGEQFVLGAYVYGDGDVKMDETLAFSLEDLTTVFGKLSNWEDLTIQQKRSVLNTGLPPLWTDVDTFRACVNDYQGGKGGWFGRMVSAQRGEDKRDGMRWLREVDMWPRSRFAVSAVTEAIEWFHREEDAKFPCAIQQADCLAEWAARLMIRKTYLNSLGNNDESTAHLKLSRSHELAWCERANEIALSSFVLDCVKRNTPDLYESETLPWLRQKVLALRAMGLERNDSDLLRKALSDVETYAPQFLEKCSPGTVTRIEQLTLQLHSDLKTLTQDKVEDITGQIQRIHVRPTQQDKRTLESVYELCLTYYDDQWGECSDQNALLSHMTDVLGQVVDLDLSRSDAFLAVILSRLDHYKGQTLGESVAKKLLDKIQHLHRSLDEFTIQQLTSLSNIFPSHLRNDYPVMSERDDEGMMKYKKCFQLLCDTEYLLLHYCGSLHRALGQNDAKEWREIFNRIKGKMFENPFGGSDYQLLTKYKNRLYQICEYDSTDSFKSKAEQTLKDLIRELKLCKPQNVLRLSQLCPLLAKRDGGGSERDRCIAKLLGLPAGVTVVRFDEQISVFTDSVRRPGVVRALLSSGSARRYLRKSGEPLGADAAAARALQAAHRLWRRTNPAAYTVTPLSDDCGLIEFLEDHERLRTLVSGSCSIDGVLDAVPRPADHELILAPTHASLQQHQRLCDRVPAHALRSAVERHSACVQDFILKKQRFLETVATMTIITWVLGLGDRHLQNILCSIQDGGVCCVDWAALFQYGGAELPPARLTRNMLAVCNNDVLESRLQALLRSLRDSHKLFLPIIKISFKWMGAQFDEKFAYIESIVRGAATSYDVTREVVDKTNTSKYKRKYTLLLDNVFRDCETKDVYSVEEQVSCLLRHCTDPQILAVTRSGWEPWI